MSNGDTAGQDTLNRLRRFTGESTTLREGQQLSDADLAILVSILVDQGVITTDNYLAVCRAEPEAFDFNPYTDTAAGGSPVPAATFAGFGIQATSKISLRSSFTEWLKGLGGDALARLVDVAEVARSDIRAVAGPVGLAEQIDAAFSTAAPEAVEQFSDVIVEVRDGSTGEWRAIGRADVEGLGRATASPLVTLLDAPRERFLASFEPGTDYQIRVVVNRGGPDEQTYETAAQMLWGGATTRERDVARFRAGLVGAAEVGATDTAINPTTGLMELVYPDLETAAGEQTTTTRPGAVTEVAGLPSGVSAFDALGTLEDEAQAAVGTAGRGRYWLYPPEGVYQQEVPQYLGMPSGASGVRVRREDGTDTEVAAYWEVGDPQLYFSTWSAEALAALQLRMERAHILRPGAYRLGYWDMASQEAMEAVMAYANNRGVDATDPRTQAYASAGAATANVGQRPQPEGGAGRLTSLLAAMDLLGDELPIVPVYQAPRKRRPDNATLAQIVRDAFVSQAGRQPSDMEMQHYIGYMSSQYRLSYEQADLDSEREWIQRYVDEGYVPTANQQATLTQGAGTMDETIDPTSRFYEAFARQEGPLVKMAAQRENRGKLTDSLIGSALVGRSM